LVRLAEPEAGIIRAVAIDSPLAVFNGIFDPLVAVPEATPVCSDAGARIRIYPFNPTPGPAVRVSLEIETPAFHPAAITRTMIAAFVRVSAISPEKDCSRQNNAQNENTIVSFYFPFHSNPP
jgi:hypothetical protein